MPMRSPSIALALSLLGLALPATAAEVPPTAYSRSVLVPPELLGHFSLLFVYPHLAGSTDGQLLATAASGSSAPGAGANLRAGSNGIFVLSQTATTVPRGFATTYRVFQIGWGVKVGDLGLGLAGRASQNRTLSEDGTVYFDDRDGSQSTRDEDFKNREVGLGLGYSRSRFQADVELGVCFESNVATSRFVRGDETRQAELRTDNDPRPTVAARLVVPAGSGTDLILAGSFRDGRLRADGFRRDVVDSTESFEEVHIERYGHQWTVGAALEIPNERWGIGRLFMHYENVDGRPRPFSARSDIRDFVEYDFERVRAGISIEREVWWEVTLLSGLQSSFEIFRESREELERDGDSRLFRTVDESLDHDFAWGVRRSFSQIDLIGSMKLNLEVLDPFFSLDIGLRF